MKERQERTTIRLYPGQMISEREEADAYIHDSLHYCLKSEDLDAISGLDIIAKVAQVNRRLSSSRQR